MCRATASRAPLVLVSLLLVSGVLGHSDAEIQKRGEEIMEEYRADLGHWIRISSIEDWVRRDPRT